MDIYPAGDEYTVGIRFPKALSVWVSEDGKEYTKVAERTDIDVFNWGAITFDTVSARYAFEANDKKLLIISPAVDNVYITDGKAKRRLESGDRLMEYWLYDGEGFLNAVRRKTL